MPDDEEKWSLVDSEIPCAEPDCGSPALTTCDFCWEHLPEDQQEGFKDKIEKIAKDRNGDLHKFIFRGAVISRATFKKVNFTDANLQKAILNMVMLQCANLTGANLRGTILRHANLQETNLTGIEYDKNTCFIGADIRNINWSQNPSLERHIRDQQWLHDFKQSTKKSRKLKIWEYIWRETCDYGKSISRWIVCSTCLAVYFGILYDLLPIINSKESANTWLTPYYYSVVTFTTLGFGDVVPRNAYGEFAVTLEVILGYIMLGGLISIFANKLARRS